MKAMSKRSPLWQKKKNQLDQRELALRGDLDQMSGELESRAKKIAVASLVVVGVAVIGYGLYRSFSDQSAKKQKPQKAPAIKDDSKSAASEPMQSEASSLFRNVLFQKIGLLLIELLGRQIAKMVSGKVNDALKTDLTTSAEFQSENK